MFGASRPRTHGGDANNSRSDEVTKMMIENRTSASMLFEMTESRKRVVLFTILCFLVML